MRDGNIWTTFEGFYFNFLVVFLLFVLSITSGHDWRLTSTEICSFKQGNRLFLLTWNGNRPVEVHVQTARSNICTWKVLSSRAVFIRPEQLFSNFVVFTEQSDSKKPVTVHAARKAHIGREQIICFYLFSEFTEHSSTKYHQNSGDRYRRSLFRAMTRGFWSALLFVLITVVTVIVTSDLNLGVSASGPLWIVW